MMYVYVLGALVTFRSPNPVNENPSSERELI
jgi:hypothetical protein